MRDRIYRIGVVVAFLGMTGYAEAITGNGSGSASVAWFTVGFVMCLAGYTNE